MKDLLEALTIFAKYADADCRNPTGCEHDELYVYIDPAVVSIDDVDRLKELGFNADQDSGNFYSFRFGSA